MSDRPQHTFEKVAGWTAAALWVYLVGGLSSVLTNGWSGAVAAAVMVAIVLATTFYSVGANREWKRRK